MRTVLLLSIFLCQLFAQERIILEQYDIVDIPAEVNHKIFSGLLVHQLSEKIYARKNNISLKNADKINIFIYLEDKITKDQVHELQSLEITVHEGFWIPPMPNHPYGFTLAQVPVDKFIEMLYFDFIIKVETAEHESFPMNNQATKKIKADVVWGRGWTGTGIKVAVLDSGLDTEPAHPDFPAVIQKRDYSNYPTSIDDNVENTVSGHGTHVAGSVLGRGALSLGNVGNGGGAYKGAAPEADLIFLKIGSDANASASGAAMQAAMIAAVDTFDADIVTMSYGGWYAHHDGSSSIEQTVDWVYSQGVPFFISAGNDGNRGRHFSGMVAAESSTDFIRIDVLNAAANSTYLYFNLVWSDGTERKNLSLNYYNNSQTLLGSVTQLSTTESLRGTESKYSYYNAYVPPGSSTWYLKVVNPSSSSQSFHIYEVWNDGKVTFNLPDPFYTIGQPASADYAFSVGASVSRSVWQDYQGNFWTFGNTLDDIAPFSSRGPRVDGALKPSAVAPGSVIISVRDRDVLTSPNVFWIDSDGSIGSGGSDYYVMQGTSMACPIAAGAAALILNRYPDATPDLVYSAMKNFSVSDAFTGAVPNNTWGYGKLDINAAIDDSALPVELSLFSAILRGQSIHLAWQTVTEIDNYGFDVERMSNDIWENIGFVAGHGNSNSTKDYSFIDENVIAGKYSYRLKQIDNDGAFSYSDIIEVELALPAEYGLSQNYPNPFNPATTISYQLPVESSVQLNIYTILGELAAVLVNEKQEAGSYNISFDAGKLASGTYIYRLIADDFLMHRKMILIK
jgi:subtilisin family serine protease